MLLPQDLQQALPAELAHHWPSFVIRWAAKRGNVDLSLRMHALRWSAEDAAPLLQQLNAEHGHWSKFSFEKGELQLQFSANFWAELLKGLNSFAAPWLNLERELEGSLALPTKPEVVGLAHILAEEEGWETDLQGPLMLHPMTWENLQELLFFTTLQAEEEGRRQFWLKWLRKLWNRPILFVEEPQESFCRLQMLRFWLRIPKQGRLEIVE
jgi:hypothetical protein